MRLSAIGAADTGFSNCNSLIISFSFATHSNQRMYTTRVSAFSFYLKKKTPAKEKQTSRSRSTPATPRRSTQPATLSQRLGTFARKLASLKQYGLVRLASQAVQPSQNIVAYRPWSGRYAPCFSPTSPRFIRHRRRFGDVARLSKIDFKHYGAAIESLIIKIG